ncbi:MAG: hypothetical protein EOP85_16780 [Verrucomicrobiaceae bacterium]|nr:MAG: hypothetical protein EOP85_16780 [Verrucomicrobiaceae bacterium]
MKFGCKTYFVYQKAGSSFYEERVVEVEASGFDEAIGLAEEEGDSYATSVSGRRVDYVQCFSAIDAPTHPKVREVYSLLRKSELGEHAFLDLYEDTGGEMTSADSRAYVDFQEFVEKGVDAFSARDLLRIHILRYNEMSYQGIAEIMFSSETLHRDSMAAVAHTLERLFGPLGTAAAVRQG